MTVVRVNRTIIANNLTFCSHILNCIATFYDPDSQFTHQYLISFCSRAHLYKIIPKQKTIHFYVGL